MPIEYPKFHEKLRLDNLYPTLPQKKIRGNPLYEQFKKDLPRDTGMVEQIGQQAQPNAMSVTKPMDVVFNDNNISEHARAVGAARTVHNVDLSPNALSPYQYGQLANRNRQLDIQEQNYAGNRNLGQQRVDETAEMGEWKRNNPGGRIVYQPDGNIIAIGPDNKIAGNFGPSGKMAEERKIGMNQQNTIQQIDRRGEVEGAVEGRRQEGRMQSGAQAGLNAIATEAAKAGNRPTSTTRDVSYQYGPEGQIIGAKSNTKQVMPPKPAPGQGTTVTMYGPNGEGPYSIPTERTDEMQDRYKMRFQK